ncbi:uncharacterized protein V1513DRAFT_372126 [Lipomyces chichibuensis]|uniref:uncharacterized protein n=1 Tax=Lipomyces chichibuensis TaxID=1546026 RepID=UPI00334364DE
MVLLLTSASESSSTLQGMILADRAAAAAAAQDALSTQHVSKILDTTVHVVEPEILIYNDDNYDDDEEEELDVVDVECSGDSSRDETENVGSFSTGFDDSMATHYPDAHEDLDDVPEMADNITTDLSETRKIILSEYDMDESTEAEPMHDNREANIADYDDDAEDDEQDEDDRFELSSSPSIQDESDIDLSLVYALHTFKATQNGHADAVKGDAMVLLDDSNEYWWLVRMIKDSTIGYLPAEKIETPSERLARLNKHRNIDIVASDVISTRTSSERSRNPLKRFRPKKAATTALLTTSNKTVSFTAPTFYDPPEGYYISDEESELMGDEDSETDEDGASDEELEQEQENVNANIVQEVVITDQTIDHMPEGVEETVEITAVDITHDNDEEQTLDTDTTLRDDMDVDNASAYTGMHTDLAVDPFIGDAGCETSVREDEAQVLSPNTNEDNTTFLDTQSMPAEAVVSNAVEQAAEDDIRVAVEPAVSFAASIPRSKDTMQLSAIAFDGVAEPAAAFTGSSAATSMTYRAASPSSCKTQRHIFQHPLTPSHGSSSLHQSAKRDAQSPPSSTPTTSGLPPVLRQTAATPAKAEPVSNTRGHKWTASSRTKLRRKEPNGLLNTKSSLDKLSLRYRINGGNGVLGNIFKKKTSQSSTSLESSESNAMMQARPSVSSEETSVRSTTPSSLSASVLAMEGRNSEVQNAASGSLGEQKEDKESLRPSYDQIFAARTRTPTYDSMYSDTSTAIMQPFAGYGGYDPETESLNERKYSSVDDNLDAIGGSNLQDDTVTTEATQDDTFYTATNLLASYSNSSDDGASTIGSSTDSSGGRDSSSRSSPPHERNAAFERHSDDDIDTDQQAPADEDLVSLMLHAASRNEIVHPALASSFRDATRIVDLASSKLDELLFQWWDARREVSAPPML